MNTTNSATVQFTLFLDYDFNSPPNEAGFYHVLLDGHLEPMVRNGDIVSIGSEGIRRRGRVRCLLAVVEPIGDFEHEETP
jgi:hypothetical protein